MKSAQKPNNAKSIEKYRILSWRCLAGAHEISATSMLDQDKWSLRIDVACRYSTNTKTNINTNTNTSIVNQDTSRLCNLLLRAEVECEVIQCNNVRSGRLPNKWRRRGPGEALVNWRRAPQSSPAGHHAVC